MKTVVQRVLSAKVEVDHEITGSIHQGLVILLGVEKGDTEKEGKWLVEKIANLRIFQDEQGKMNRSVCSVDGSVLIVSQFTLLADCQHGRRPAFTDAAKPDEANRLYLDFIAEFEKIGVRVQTGRFGADMQLTLTNDGPVTILLDRTSDS